MPQPSPAVPRRSTARSPRTPRRTSRRTRLHRTVAVAATIAITVGVAVATRGSHAHRPAHARKSAIVARNAPRPPDVVQLAAAAAPWQLDVPRSRATAYADGNAVVVAGGIDTAQQTLAAVTRFDAVTGAATADGTLLVPTHDAAGATLGAQQLVFGGGAQQVTDAVQALVPGGTSRLVGRLPQPRADLAAVTVGSTAYLAGGYDGTNATPDVLATTDGATFRTVGRLPYGVRYPAVAALGESLYVFGGESAGIATDAVQQVDLRTGDARVVAHLPVPVSAAVAVTLDGAIFVAGGRSGANASTTVLRFDPATEQFTYAATLPGGFANGAAVASGTSAYLLGGETTTVVASVATLRATAAPAGGTASYAAVRPFAGRMLIADRGNNRLIVVDAAKHRSWIYPSPSMPPPAGGFYFPDDGFFADHGTAIVTNQEENNTIVKIGFPSGALEWSYGTPKVAGSAPGLLNQPDDAFLLRDGSYSVADAKNCRILRISAAGAPVSQIGTTGDCVHDPPRALGYPNGDTPLANGDFLVSEINGSWVSEYTAGGALVWTVHLPIAYPSDPQQLGPDLYLVADYARPGGILEFTREGSIVWTYRPASGEGMLDHPSLAERLPNGLIGVNDDYRHRVVLIDPTTNAIVWQYGRTDAAGTGPDQLDTPDGFDLLFPDNSTPQHPQTG